MRCAKIIKQTFVEYIVVDKNIDPKFVDKDWQLELPNISKEKIDLKKKQVWARFKNQLHDNTFIYGEPFKLNLEKGVE